VRYAGRIMAAQQPFAVAMIRLLPC